MKKENQLKKEDVLNKKKLSDRNVPFVGVILKRKAWIKRMTELGHSEEEILDNVVQFYQEKNMVRIAQARVEPIEEELVYLKLSGTRVKMSPLEKMAREVSKKTGKSVEEVMKALEELGI